MKQELDLCDIGQAREPRKDAYTIRQQYFFGLIQCRLDFVFISHNFKRVIKNPETLGAMSTDYSALLFALFNILTNLKKVQAYGNLTIH